MAPEQTISGSDVDTRADIYSICAVFCDLLTLRSHLKPQASLATTLAAVREQKARHPFLMRHAHQASIPADLAHFVIKGLEKAQDERYQSIEEMRGLLKRRDDGYVAIQCPMTFSKRAMHGVLHQIDRHPMLTMMTLLGMLVAVGFGIRYAVTLLF